MEKNKKKNTKILKMREMVFIPGTSYYSYSKIFEINLHINDKNNILK